MLFNRVARRMWMLADPTIYAVCLTYDLFSCLFILLFQLSQRRELTLKAAVDVERGLRLQAQKQYRASRENIDIINRKCHDLKHQVSALRLVHDPEEREDSLREIERQVMIYDTAAQTGNEVLDTVLTEKGLLCEQDGISWSCMADGAVLDFISPVDLYILLGNALDNAIESSRAIPSPERRVVRLSVRREHGAAFIQVENYYDHPLKEDGGEWKTTKEVNVFGWSSTQWINGGAGSGQCLTFTTDLFAGESNDTPTTQFKQVTKGGDIIEDTSRTYLDLSTEEEELLAYVGENFENVIVLVNTTNTMVLGPIETIPGIDAALLVGGTGDKAAAAIPEVLFGDVNPSGHVTDTYAYDFRTAASFANIGKDGTGAYTNGEGLYPYDGTTNGNLGVNGGVPYEQVSYVDYVEGIYVGYKWYETTDAEGYWDGVSNDYGNGYDGVVQYPFGYGLSYTSFDWEIVSAASGALDKDGTVDVTVKVTNTGSGVVDGVALDGSDSGGSISDLGLKLGADFDDPQWDDLLDQMTVDEMIELTLHGYVHTAEAPSIGKPRTLDLDGPTQVASFAAWLGAAGTGFPNPVTLAQTFNKELVHEFGLVNGAQARQLGVNGLYAPAANMHRTPFGARNYEYYSEDSCLSGVCATLTVQGELEAGTFVYVKHFICDDADAYIYRDSIYTWMTEQTLREIYLSPFRMMVQEGGCTGLMSSYNRIGAVWAGASQALLKNVLRDEWGFEGAVITDYADHHAFMNGDHMIRSGGDLWMDGWLSDGAYDYETSSNSIQQALRLASKHIIYMTLNAEARRADYAAGGGDTLYITEASTSLNVWLTALIAFDVVVVLAEASYFILRARKSKKQD